MTDFIFLSDLFVAWKYWPCFQIAPNKVTKNTFKIGTDFQLMSKNPRKLSYYTSKLIL